MPSLDGVLVGVVVAVNTASAIEISSVIFVVFVPYIQYSIYSPSWTKSSDKS